MLSLSFLLASTLGYVVACTDASVGVPCSTNADCESGMICDTHDGQGTCQNDHGHAGATGSTGDTGASETGPHDETATGCAAEDRDDTFAIGLSKSGVTVTATFVSADPAPPIKGDNTWVLSFADAMGAPLDGLTISVVPMMPDHGHGTPVVAEVSPTGNPGEYQVTPVNLFMAGYWQVDFELSTTDMQDTLMFGFCVE